jgi:hypothetical protein
MYHKKNSLKKAALAGGIFSKQLFAFLCAFALLICDTAACFASRLA